MSIFTLTWVVTCCNCDCMRELTRGFYSSVSAQKDLSEVHTEFGISDEYGVVAMIPIGYPLGKLGPVTRKPLEEVVSLERWGNSLPVA